MNTKRTCKVCNVEKEFDQFVHSRTYKGKVYRKHTCNQCHYQSDEQRAYIREYQKGSAPYKEVHRIAQAKYMAKYPERQKARELAQKLVELKSACEDCGSTKVALHRHHEDYAKPLEVVSLCPLCHKRRHYYAQVQT